MSRLTAEQLDQLAEIAERSVVAAVRDRRELHPDPAGFAAPLRDAAAVFVTLRRHGQLRGCIGTLEATDPAVEAVADRARAAALHDPRFEPVGIDELDDLDVSVSVLSRPIPIDAHSYDDLRRRLRPGVDGVVVDAGRHRATFLPSVWEELADPDEFLHALWRKAGLVYRAWPPGIVISCYTAQHAPPATAATSPSTSTASSSSTSTASSSSTSTSAAG